MSEYDDLDFGDDFEIDLDAADLEDGIYQAQITQARLIRKEKEDKGTSITVFVSCQLEMDGSFVSSAIWLGYNKPDNRQGLNRLRQLCGALGMDTSGSISIKSLMPEVRTNEKGESNVHLLAFEKQYLNISVRTKPGADNPEILQFLEYSDSEEDFE